MAQEKQTPLGNQEIMTLVDAKAKEAVGWYDSRISKERQRVINYVNAVLPARQSDGNSSYVSSDVYDSVEAMKAQIVETFSANPDNLIAFPPLGQKDIEAARIATEYTNHIFFIENDGEGLIQQAAHDGLTARAGLWKLYWDDCTDRTEESFSGLSYQDVQALAAQPDVSELNSEADDATGLFSGTLIRDEDVSQVCVDPIAPEEFLIEPRARTIASADYCGHRTLKTKAELIRMGYKPSVVKEIHYDDDKGLDLSPEVLAREAQVASAYATNNPIQPELEKVMFYESYAKLDRRDGKGVRLYKICHAGGTLLAIDEVDRAPFKAFVPLPIPHMFWGNNFAARVIPTQNARTVLTRGILDHTAATTNPRYTVLKGGLLNPREMLDNRLRGIVNINRPDAVKALEVANLNPFVFQTIEMLKQNKEESTGISSLSQGLNKDAISTQNSSALVDNLVSLSMQRQKIIARNFAKFLGEVYLEIYRLVLENQAKERQKIIEVAGNFVPVSTKDWIKRDKVKLAIHVGYSERDRMASKYASLYTALNSDPNIKHMFTDQNRFALITDGMKTAGFDRWSTYITSPQIAQKQPSLQDMGLMAQTKAKTDTAQAAILNAQANVQKVQNQHELGMLKEQIAELSSHVKAVLQLHAELRKDNETENRIDIAQREMKLAEEAPQGTATDIISPRG